MSRSLDDDIAAFTQKFAANAVNLEEFRDLTRRMRLSGETVEQRIPDNILRQIDGVMLTISGDSDTRSYITRLTQSSIPVNFRGYKLVSDLGVLAPRRRFMKPLRALLQRYEWDTAVEIILRARDERCQKHGSAKDEVRNRDVEMAYRSTLYPPPSPTQAEHKRKASVHDDDSPSRITKSKRVDSPMPESRRGEIDITQRRETGLSSPINCAVDEQSHVEELRLAEHNEGVEAARQQCRLATVVCKSSIDPRSDNLLVDRLGQSYVCGAKEIHSANERDRRPDSAYAEAKALPSPATDEPSEAEIERGRKHVHALPIDDHSSDNEEDGFQCGGTSPSCASDISDIDYSYDRSSSFRHVKVSRGSAKDLKLLPIEEEPEQHLQSNRPRSRVETVGLLDLDDESATLPDPVRNLGRQDASQGVSPEIQATRSHNAVANDPVRRHPSTFAAEGEHIVTMALESLRPGKRLTGSGIKAILDVCNLSPITCYIVDPLALDTSDPLRNRQKKLRSLTLRHAKIIVPLHCNGNHWCVAIASFNGQTVQMLDPLQQQRNYATIQATCAQFLHGMAFEQRKVMWKYECYDQVLQLDDFNCGIHCLLFAIADMVQIPELQTLPTELARRFFSTILHSLTDADARISVAELPQISTVPQALIHSAPPEAPNEACEALALSTHLFERGLAAAASSIVNMQERRKGYDVLRALVTRIREAFDAEITSLGTQLAQIDIPLYWQAIGQSPRRFLQESLQSHPLSRVCASAAGMIDDDITALQARVRELETERKDLARGFESALRDAMQTVRRAQALET